MSLIETWVQSPGAAALGKTLLHSLWEGAAVALVLAVALCFLRSSRARYAAGCLAMVSLLGIFGFTFIRIKPPQPLQWITEGGSRIPLEEFDVQGQVTGSGMLPSPADYVPWLAPFWIAGVLLFQARSLTNWMAARRLGRTGVCGAPEFWQGRLGHLSTTLRISRPVTLLESCLAEVPVVIGHIRPVILMPVGLLAGLPAGQLEAILLHELAHIRRYDYLANLVQQFVESLLFYHPAVWWVSSVIRTERENCCDDLVVAVKGGAFEYATALAALEQNRGGRREALAATGGNLVKRIRRLLAQPEQPSAALTPVVTAAILTATVMTAMAWQTSPAVPAVPAAKPPVKLLSQQKQGPPSSRQADPIREELMTPYKKWLNEDVTYIIRDDERQVFKQLATDQEREKFIEQFWLRRDPTPGTTENEMKEEHYRRIAYANQRYSDARVPGWKTDRGRIYISYGPADEIEAHPSGGTYRLPPEQGGGTTSTFPFEQWRYKWIDGIGTNVVIEFVDPAMTGEYRMTLDPSEKDALRFIPAASLTDRTPGKSRATVQVMGNSAALISIPLDTYGDHQVKIYGRVTTQARRQIETFEDTIQGPAPIYTRFVAVRAGAYRFNLVVKDVTTGQLISEELGFEVK